MQYTARPNRTAKARVKAFMRKTLTLLVAAAVFGFVFFFAADYKKQAISTNRNFAVRDAVPALLDKPSAAAAPAPQLLYAPEIEGMQLVYAETFDSGLLDPSVWSAVYQQSVYNEELQVYHPDQVSVADGQLQLTASRTAQGGYVSGKVDTKDKLELVYGRVDVRMRLCDGAGLFPAIWLLHADAATNTYVEIDIMENIGQEPETVYGVLHMNTEAGRVRDYASFTVHDPLEFHVYTVQWTADSIVWSVDGEEYFRFDASVPAVPMHLIINLAVGGTWAGAPDEGTAFPAHVQVDCVRVYAPEAER